MDILCFLAGNDAVNINRTVAEGTVAVGLFKAGGYVVKPCLFNIEFPFDPLICRAELIALYLVELDNIKGCGICKRGRTVPFGINGCSRFKVHILGLAAHGVVSHLSVEIVCTGGSELVTLLLVFLLKIGVRNKSGSLLEGDAVEHHSLLLGFQLYGMCSGGKVEFKVLTVLTAGIDTFSVIPSVDLNRACADVVSVLVEGYSLVAISPHSGENNTARLGKGRFAVDVKRAFNGIVLSGNGVVKHINNEKSVVLYIYRPGCRSVYAVIRIAHIKRLTLDSRLGQGVVVGGVGSDISGRRGKIGRIGRSEGYGLRSVGHIGILCNIFGVGEFGKDRVLLTSL